MTHRYMIAFVAILILMASYVLTPQEKEETYILPVEPGKVLSWELDSSVDHWEIYLGKTKDPGEGRYAGDTFTNDISCYVLEICDDSVYVHIRAVRNGLKSTFASIYWDRGLNTDAESFEHEGQQSIIGDPGRSWISVGKSVPYV